MGDSGNVTGTQRFIARRLFRYFNHVAVLQVNILLQILSRTDFLVIEMKSLLAPQHVDFGFLGEFSQPSRLNQRFVDGFGSGQRVRSRLPDSTGDVVLLAVDFDDLDIDFGMIEIHRQLLRNGIGELLRGQSGSFYFPGNANRNISVRSYLQCAAHVRLVQDVEEQNVLRANYVKARLNARIRNLPGTGG